MVKKRHIVLCGLIMAWFVCLFIGLSTSFSNFYESGDRGSDGIFYLIIEVVTILYIVSTRHERYPREIVFASLFLLVQVLVMIGSAAGNPSIMVMRSSLWVVAMVGLYKYLLCNPDDVDYFTQLFAIGLTVLAIYTAVQQAGLRKYLGYDTGLNELYCVLIGAPFLFLQSRKITKYLGCFAIVIMTALSLKMTAFVAIVASVFAYVVIDGKVQQKRINPWLLVLLSIVLIICIFWQGINNFLYSLFQVDWGEKIFTANSTGGSGRTQIWAEVIALQKRSDPGEWIFGHGYNSVVSQIRFSAHNDFLEVLYDFGIIGILAYSLMLISLIGSINRLVRMRSMYAPVLGMSVTMFVVISMFSHFVIVPGLLVNGSLVWAVCLSQQRVSNSQTQLKQ